MKETKWNKVKSERLKLVRGVSFEDIIASEFIKFEKHPKREAQNIMLFRYRGYIWVVPYVENEEYRFLKTLYPSRKYTKLCKRRAL
jgi:hypothetical protein